MANLALESWKRVVDFLEEKFPVAYDFLRPAASDEQIDALETALGRGLPSDIRTVLFCNNGSDESYVLGSWFLMGTRDILAEWKLNNQIAAENPDYEWLPEWLPVLGNGGGDFLVLDMDTGECLEAFHDPYDRVVVAPSFGCWLAGLADRLEAGHYEVIEEGEVFALLSEED